MRFWIQIRPKIKVSHLSQGTCPSILAKSLLIGCDPIIIFWPFLAFFFVIPGRGGNEQKFMGEGQMFKGKLIGVLEVQEARGDRMCQDALQELKTAIKASGEHKQRILIHIAVDGLKIRDEKTGVRLFL